MSIAFPSLIARRAGIACLALLLAACAAGPPVQEMSDARLAISAARDAGAAEWAPDGLARAEAKLERAEDHLGKRVYWAAKRDAVSAKEEAFDALLVSRKLSDPDVVRE